MDNYKRVLDIVRREGEDGKVLPTMSDKIAKMTEEFGEFSAVHLESTGYKRVKNKRSEEEITEHLLEELCDMRIMVMDMMSFYGFTKEQIHEMTDKKLDKWESYL